MERDFARYLECGVLVHGFARVRFEALGPPTQGKDLETAFQARGYLRR